MCERPRTPQPGVGRFLGAHTRVSSCVPDVLHRAPPSCPKRRDHSVHDRMPVILDADGYDLWLDPGMRDVGAASELLKPYNARLMWCYPIRTRISHVVHDDADCSRPVKLAEVKNSLFS